MQFQPNDQKCKQAVATFRRYGRKAHIKEVGFGKSDTDIGAEDMAENDVREKLPDQLDPPYCYDVQNVMIGVVGTELITPAKPPV